jgi:HAD superfamily hydrolase (TIGR01509 family)
MTSEINRRALLFDLDGTLADSLSVMRLVYGRFLGGFDSVGTDIEFARLNGPPLTEVVRLLKQAHKLPEGADVLLGRYQDLIDQAYTEVAPTAGAHAVLEQAKASGYVAGVVTSNSARRTRDWLNRVGLGGLVDVLIGGEDVQRGKPDPEPYLLATARAGCSAAMSLAVEDSSQGARAAQDAGLRTFVLDPDPNSATIWPEGVERIRSLSDLAEILRTVRE